MDLDRLIELFYANKLSRNVILYNTSSTAFGLLYDWIHENFDELNLITMSPVQIQVLRIMYIGLCGCCKQLIDFNDIMDTEDTRWSSTPNYWKDWDLYDENHHHILNYPVTGIIGMCESCIEKEKINKRNKELKKFMKKSRCKQTDYCCPICMEDIEIETHQIRLKCKHAFHPTCISSWTTHKSTCPCCRSDILHS